MSDETGVITTTTVAPIKVPKSFRDLKKDELVEAANHFGTDPQGNVIAVMTDLEDSGVTWEMYTKAFLLPQDEPSQTEVELKEFYPSSNEEVNVITETVQVQEAPVTAPKVEVLQLEKKYLLKFIGENPYFERGRYKFTQEKPYAAMDAENAQDALVQEPDKFRQAYPAELQEFYS